NTTVSTNSQTNGQVANGQTTAAPAATNAGAAAPATGGVTPAQIRAMIDRDGASQTVQALDKDEGAVTFDMVLDGIASGRDEWLALVPLLAGAVDGGTGTGLEIAVAEALPRNAAGVLRLIGNGRTAAETCGYPMIEATTTESSTYFSAALPAVEAVNDPALQAAKTSCLSELRKAQSSAAG
ncbi:MAG TPA: hypothetical protein VEY69_09965, partial [Lautropia sp.]|nr:hypothetical protein [Lautropia sp.]